MTERERRLAELDELLLRAATEQLDADESQNLEALRREFPEVDTHAYERAAAAVLLATLRPVEPVPESVTTRIFQRGLALLDQMPMGEN